MKLLHACLPQASATLHFRYCLLGRTKLISRLTISRQKETQGHALVTIDQHAGQSALTAQAVAQNLPQHIAYYSQKGPEIDRHTFRKLIRPSKSWHHHRVQCLEASRASWQPVLPKIRLHSYRPAACGESAAYPPLPQHAAAQHAAVAHLLQCPPLQLRLQSHPPQSQMHVLPASWGQVEPLQAHPTSTAQLHINTATLPHHCYATRKLYTPKTSVHVGFWWLCGHPPAMFKEC